MSKRSVRFSSSTKDGHDGDEPPPPSKRSRMMMMKDDDDDEYDRKPAAAAAAASAKPNKTKTKNKQQRYRPNEDELDDIDEWDEKEDDDEGFDGTIPTESQLIEAKRQRRQKRVFGGGEDDTTHIDNETSLATEGVKIEPFHMRDEENDGMGYFDGDTYIFRKQPADDDGEPDAWADSLRDEDGNPTTDLARDTVPKVASSSSGRKSSQENLDDWTKEQLYGRILPLVSDTETVAKAIRRYGQIVKQQRKQKGGGGGKNKKYQSSSSKDGGGGGDDEDDEDDNNLAKSCLDDLTGAANALLLQGDVDIYDTTRADILRMFPSSTSSSIGQNGGMKSSTTTNTTSTSSPSNNKQKVQWEYMGNQDNQLHGPFTTQQMLDWVSSGYFVGPQRVKIRTISEQQEEEEPPQEKKRPELSTEEDLLADLMDDDDDDDDDEKEKEERPAKKLKNNIVKGEWLWSNEIDYKKYF
jgi:CD2 antigen cytoplasmic tail-binding protein 2